MDNVRKFWEQVKELYQKMSKKTRKTLLVVLCSVLVLSFVAALLLNYTTYETLFYNLNSQEVTEIAGKLQEYGVDYKTQGDSLQVSKKQVDEIRGRLAQEGYPKSGLSYGAFIDNVGMMTTDFEKNTYKLIALQDRIEATIRKFQGVKDSVVTIALGEEQKYVLQKDKVEPSASVVVFMQNGGAPSQVQVSGVQRLVATSIPGMSMDSVAVFDGNGNEVTATNHSVGQLGASQLKFSLEQEIESSVKAKLMHLLEPLFGENKVRVSVKSNVDVDKKIKEIISYLPQEDGKGVISSETNGTEIIRGDNAAGGVVGTETNTEIPVYEGITLEGNEVYFRDENAIDYVVSQVKEQVQSDAGVCTDLTVAVALDDVYLDDDKTGELKKLIATTAGIDEDIADSKVSLLNHKWVESENTGGNGLEVGKPTIVELAIIAGVALVLIVFIVILILSLTKGKKKKKKAAAQQDLSDDQLQQLAANLPNYNYEEIDLSNIKNTREMELKQKIGEFAEGNPEISAQLIRTWLMGGDET